MFRYSRFIALSLLSIAFPAIAQEESDPLLARPFAIKVIDAETDRPVPLVELRTVSGIRAFTDNAGIVTFSEPGFAKKKIYFHVASPGYSVAEDGFGFRGKRLFVNPGETLELSVTRNQLAQRMFRITGSGRFHHSARMGLPVPDWAQPINSGVAGQDSAHTAIFKGKLFWLWGDTNKPGYPLGEFHTTAATSPLPADDPAEAGITLTYFVNESGEAKGVAKMPGEGPTWLGGLIALKNKEGEEKLVASYVKVRGFLDVYERGLCEWDSASESFKHIFTFPKDTLGSALFPNGHPIRHRVKDRDYLYFGSGFPKMRIPATYGAWRKPTAYEAVKCDIALTDAQSGKPIEPHFASICWNTFRKKYLAVFAEIPEKGAGITETWISEAPAPEGPWRKAVKIVSHAPHSFYNPLQHPEFSQEDGRIIYFEGTYTTLFAKQAVPTPRFEYNQILYRLDLQDFADSLKAKQP